jgi:hypothetical protein
METEAGRRCAEAINEESDALRQQHHRLTTVFDEYLEYERGWQLDLAEAAIASSIAALAFHDRRHECDTHFCATVDCMYALSGDAERDMSADERKNLYTTAGATRSGLIHCLGEITRSSFQQLDALPEKDPRRVVANTLHNVRVTFIEHASSVELRTLTSHCLVVYSAIDDLLHGLESEYRVRMADLHRAALDIINRLLGAIKAGKLHVKDGKIVNLNERE